MEKEYKDTYLVDEDFINYLKRSGYEIEEFTCYTCKYVEKCVFAYDFYNTNGDCLENK